MELHKEARSKTTDPCHRYAMPVILHYIDTCHNIKRKILGTKRNVTAKLNHLVLKRWTSRKLIRSLKLRSVFNQHLAFRMCTGMTHICRRYRAQAGSGRGRSQRGHSLAVTWPHARPWQLEWLWAVAVRCGEVNE